jgi:hypothetical protein
MLNKLFAKLNITSMHQFILVNIVFAITGTLSVLLAGPIMELLGIGTSSYGEIVYWVVRIFLIFFFYQCLLVIVSIPFGQFAYFRDVQKKMLARCGMRF